MLAYENWTYLLVQVVEVIVMLQIDITSAIDSFLIVLLSKPAHVEHKANVGSLAEARHECEGKTNWKAKY